MQGNLFTASATGLNPQLRSENRLALTLANPAHLPPRNREGKTVVRPATLRKMERQVSQLRKGHGCQPALIWSKK